MLLADHPLADILRTAGVVREYSQRVSTVVSIEPAAGVGSTPDPSVCIAFDGGRCSQLAAATAASVSTNASGSPMGCMGGASATVEGIHLVTVGYGMGNFNDHLMEQLADQGDGFYAYVDTFGEAVDLFVDNLTPTLTVVAEEAKIQVVFDPEVVARYRLIGYENRMLDDEDFVDDTVDAGELGAGHQVSAVYEVELANGVTQPVAGEVRLRWRSHESGEVVEVDQPLDLAAAGAPDSPSLRLAALVAHTAELLKGNTVVTERGITLEDLLAEAEALDEIGVDGAENMVELITVAIHAEDPTTDTGEG